MLKLTRPKPAMPSSYFWTWDHSCNWVLDDEGIWNEGCNNKYLKRPETFVEDYRRLTDFAAGIGIKGIVIWGFLRDSHGGVEYAKRVADYAAARNVAIMPGIGLTWYGGPYFEGQHRFNIETFLRKNPQARMITNGDSEMPGNVGICPTHPDFLSWLAEGMQWMFKEFAIGGANLENGDFKVCACERCNAHRAEWPKEDNDFFRMQALAYLPAIEAVKKQLKDKLITWHPYSSWCFGCPNQYPVADDPLPATEPQITQLIDSDSVAQWKLSAIMRNPPAPLKTFLDDGVPPRILAGDQFWPADRKPVTLRNTGFVHQGSQWWLAKTTDRYSLAISSFKEACLRGYRAGLEGISIHGEVTPRCIPCLLNYLSFSHYTHWPEDNLRDFGRKTLSQVLNSEAEGELFVELLCAWDAGTLNESQKKEISETARKQRREYSALGLAERRWGAQLWHWFERMAGKLVEKHNASFY